LGDKGSPKLCKDKVKDNGSQICSKASLAALLPTIITAPMGVPDRERMER